MMKKAIGDIAAERQRQFDVEGWTPDHDDAHIDGSLAVAAACYALAAFALVEDADADLETPIDGWPWDDGWWKPSRDPRRNLEKAGALVVAEIERLDRAANA